MEAYKGRLWLDRTGEVENEDEEKEGEERSEDANLLEPREERGKDVKKCAGVSRYNRLMREAKDLVSIAARNNEATEKVANIMIIIRKKLEGSSATSLDSIMRDVSNLSLPQVIIFSIE